MIEAQINPKDLKNLMGKLNILKPSQRNGAIFKAVQMAGFHILDKTKGNLAGKILGKGERKTGRLRSSMGMIMKHSGSKIQATIGSGVQGQQKRLPYANIHETGGIIKPRTKKFLTIPFPGIKGKARDYSNTFIAKGIIFQKIGKDGIKPLFSLKQQVKIPSSRYLSISLNQNLRRATEIMVRTIEDELKGSGVGFRK